MTRSVLEQIARQAQLIAPCPNCQLSPGLDDRPSNQMGPGLNGYHKRGRYQGAPRSSMPYCRFCKGRKYVYLNHTCECGMPAVWYNDKVKNWFCGSEECVRAYVWRKERQNTATQDCSEHWGPWHGF